MTKSRTFNSKKYLRLTHRFLKKSTAQKEATKGRQWGHLTRVVREKDGWYIYIHYKTQGGEQ